MKRSWSYCSFTPLKPPTETFSGSSRVPTSQSGAGTRDEPLRTSSREAASSIARKRIAVHYGALVGVFVIVAYFNKCANNLKIDILEINHRFI